MSRNNEFLEKEFNFENAIKNPYTKKLKKTITINLDESVINHFRAEAANAGIPYQTLINMYLKDCVTSGRHLAWK